MYEGCVSHSSGGVGIKYGDSCTLRIWRHGGFSEADCPLVTDCEGMDRVRQLIVGVMVRLF